MPKARTLQGRIFAKKLDVVPGVCLLIEAGAPCTRPVKIRGLCAAHRTYLLAAGRLEEFALPPRNRKHDLRVNPDAAEGLCRVLHAGKPCLSAARGDGICLRHYQQIWMRPDLDLADFKRRHEITFVRLKTPTAGVCVIRERTSDGRHADCADKPHARGLCQRHYHRLSANAALFEQLADPPRALPVYRLKKEPKEGVCAIIEDDAGCSNPTNRLRRICDVHQYKSGLASGGRIRELTEAFVERGYVLERKPPHAMVPGFCILLVNNVPCTGVPQHRGICHNCYALVQKYGDYEALALPPAKHAKEEIRRNERIVRGVCILVVDGVACRASVIARGLCKRHYRLLESRGVLEELGLSAEELERLPSTPHFYLDKNVVMRFAMFETFGVAPDRSSIALVDAVLNGKVRATVSLDCVRAVYSHLGHRLARPTDQGGKGLEERDAERMARNYVGGVFFRRGGLWNFMGAGEDTFAACAAEGRLPELSLEDALEVHLFASAKEEHGAELFVTADAGILRYGEAVHPEKVVAAYAETLRR